MYNKNEIAPSIGAFRTQVTRFYSDSDPEIDTRYSCHVRKDINNLTLPAPGPSLYFRIWRLKYKDGPRTEIIQIFLMAVGP